MGTFGCVRYLTMCAHVSSLCEYYMKRQQPFCLYFRFLQCSALLSLRYEDGQVGDVHINTQEAKIHREILQVIASKLCWGFEARKHWLRICLCVLVAKFIMFGFTGLTMVHKTRSCLILLLFSFCFNKKCQQKGREILKNLRISSFGY